MGCFRFLRALCVPGAYAWRALVWLFGSPKFREPNPGNWGTDLYLGFSLHSFVISMGVDATPQRPLAVSELDASMGLSPTQMLEDALVSRLGNIKKLMDKDSRVYDDLANVAWRLHGVGARCGQDAKRLGIRFRYATAFVVVISRML